jgi:hypothetical protein
MKKFLLLALLITGFFIWLNQNGPAGASARHPAVTQQPTEATPRPVSEHDWAKRSIDRASEVANQARHNTAESQQP